MRAKAAGEERKGVSFLHKNQLPGKKVFEIDQLWIIGDDDIGRLFKGQEDIQSKALLTPSTLLRCVHEAVTTAGNHHETCLRHTLGKRFGEPIGRMRGLRPR